MEWGKDVGTESIADAEEQLELRISSESWIGIPVLREVDLLKISPNWKSWFFD
ncbi:hypothetical protein [Flammeovirga kamogawensis]|uniref:Uncharacterized protein n=1 Tax=Flammeovirga kamogawensis TaxID=373891 RepID=A0ABX8H3B8_9BACT|nr:hypothetical protein [Flammeovirga kamogawensis]MBB6460510.1 hypothetical protein [Flammeovirga kamogawensis]QWG10316.1 hypothetical protein KM029_21775 [Flammeovirga kamogawensis]